MDTHIERGKEIPGSPAYPAPTGMPAKPVSKARRWVGWFLSALPALMLVVGFINAFLGSPQVLQGMAHLGYPLKSLRVLGVLELVCAVLYLLPRTAFFGAILLTAYFGGAVASHVRVWEPQFIAPVLFGLLVWIGLYLRDDRLQPLVAFRR